MLYKPIKILHNFDWYNYFVVPYLLDISTKCLISSRLSFYIIVFRSNYRDKFVEVDGMGTSTMRL